jgi:hypothetical protein
MAFKVDVLPDLQTRTEISKDRLLRTFGSRLKIAFYHATSNIHVISREESDLVHISLAHLNLSV